MIKVKKNLLDETLITDISHYVKDKLYNYDAVWTIGHSWQQELIIEGSNPVNMLAVPDFDDTLKNAYIDYDPSFKDRKFQFNIMFWNRLSAINWHNDSNYISSTIYLNKEWDTLDGGLFLYRQANNLLAIEPEFNKMIIDYDKTFHAVSMVSPWTKETRVTLQTRIFE